MGHTQEDATACDSMKKDLFLISSAINTEYGSFTSQEKLKQLVTTIQSVRQYHTGATDIVVIDCGADNLTEEQIQHVASSANDVSVFTCTKLMRKDWSDDRPDKLLYKTVGEICIWQYFFHIAPKLENAYNRVFKLSGRYQLNDTFDVTKHQFQGLVTRPYVEWPLAKELPDVYVGTVSSRLWSFPWTMMPVMNDCWYKITKDIESFMHNGKQFRMIESLLYRAITTMQLPVHHLDPIGVQGTFAHSGEFVAE